MLKAKRSEMDRSWHTRLEWLAEGFNVKLAQDDKADLLAMVYLRNAIAHDGDMFTSQQVKDYELSSRPAVASNPGSRCTRWECASSSPTAPRMQHYSSHVASPWAYSTDLTKRCGQSRHREPRGGRVGSDCWSPKAKASAVAFHGKQKEAASSSWGLPPSGQRPPR